MPPKFSLQNVLDYRHSKVEKLEVVLGRLHHQLQTAKEQLAAMEQEKQHLMEELGTYQNGNLEPSKDFAGTHISEAHPKRDGPPESRHRESYR